MKSIGITLLTGMALIILSGVLQAQNLFLNDSFESVTPPIPSGGIRGLTGTAADDADNWIASGPAGQINAHNATGSPLTGGFASPGATVFIDFATNDTSDSFTQTLSLTNGTMYQFGFDIAERDNAEPDHKMDFDLLINNAVVTTFSTAGLTTTWIPFSTIFTYTGPSSAVPVTLRSTVLTSAGNQDYYTDRYYLVPVPEPSTWLLLGGGIPLLLWRTRRR